MVRWVPWGGVTSNLIVATTLKDIALRAGVSKSTVSRVLNNKSERHRISQKTEQIVLEAARELNYRPNQLARGLRLKKTQTIGLVIPDISNPFFAYVARMIQTYAYQEAGYSLIVCNTDENLETEIEQIHLLWSKGVDGFIIMPVGLKYDHIFELMGDNLPLVLLDRCFDEIETNSVVVDNYSGAYDAVNYLITNNHERIAVIMGLPDTSTNNARVEGYVDALKEHGIRVDEQLMVGDDFRVENGYIATRKLLSLPEPPTAIFATSDLITIGVFKAVYELNYSIPKDVSLVAFDDIDFAPYLTAPLTAIHQPRRLMGEMAVKLLIDDIQSQSRNKKQKVVLPVQLIIRESVRKLPCLKGQPVKELVG